MTAATGIKRVGLAVASLLGAGLALLFILSLVIPADTVRDAVKAQIRSVTGLDPVLRGDVSVSLFPTGSVRFNDVSLGDSTGAPALSAQQLRGAAALPPLPVRQNRDRGCDAGASDHHDRVRLGRLIELGGAYRHPGAGADAEPGPDQVVLGNPHQRRHRDHPRRGLPHRRDAEPPGIRAGLALDLAHLRGHRPVQLERAAVRRHAQPVRLPRRADRRAHRAQGPPHRRTAEVRVRRQYEQPADAAGRGRAGRRHALAARRLELVRRHRPPDPGRRRSSVSR